MRRANLDVLVAWLDATRRRDRDVLLALLAPGATWGEECDSPEAVVDWWLHEAEAAADDAILELQADDERALLVVRSTDRRQFVGFDIDGHGRIARIASSERRRNVFPIAPEAAPRGIPEAPVTDGVASGPGWFVVNVADAPWLTGAFGAYTMLEGDVRFMDVGINIGVLEPGQPACWYHREGDQENFLVLKGEALLLVEEQERHLRAWDFVHCPAWTEHVFVGAGETPSTILALGARNDVGTVYPVSELALRHRAGVTTETIYPPEAYDGIPDDEPIPFNPRWLP